LPLKEEHKMKKRLLLPLLLLWSFTALGLPESTDEAEFLECSISACKFRIEGEEVWLKPKGILLPRWIGTKKGNSWCWAEMSLSRQLESRLWELLSKAKRIEISGIEAKTVPIAVRVGKIQVHLADITIDGREVAEELFYLGLGTLDRGFTIPQDERFWCRH